MKVTRGLTFFVSGVAAMLMVTAVLAGDAIWAVWFFGLTSVLWGLGKGDQK